MESKLPVTSSNNWLPLSTIHFAPSSKVVITVSEVVPVKSGFSFCVNKSVNSPIVVICVTTLVALIDTLPNLSTALIKYVPVLAGTTIEVPGLDNFFTNTIEFCHSAPDVSGL